MLLSNRAKSGPICHFEHEILPTTSKNLQLSFTKGRPYVALFINIMSTTPVQH